MELLRRKLLALAAGAAALPAASRFTWAQAYPTRALRLIVATAAGGGNDVIARLMGQALSERLGQPARRRIQCRQQWARRLRGYHRSTAFLEGTS